LDFLDFQYLTTEFELAKVFQDQTRKGVFLYFDVFPAGNEFFGPKKERNSLDKVQNFVFFKLVDMGIKKIVILR
jgi:hypothetical protein